MRNLQPADECECRDIFTIIENLGKLVLEVANVRLEVVSCSHFDVEKVVVILLGFLMGGILGEERLDYLLEFVERTLRQRIK